jgi:hypothetical protein
MDSLIWPVLLMAFALVPICFLWMGSFLRRDGALRFVLVVPVGFFGWLFGMCMGVASSQSTGEIVAFLLAAPCAGWITSVPLLRMLPDTQVSWPESLLIASAGWMPAMGILYLLILFG